MWFVTVVEKIEERPNSFTNTGDTRTWGFYSNKNDAVQSLHENRTDMREDFYDYAVIEEYEEGICNDTGNRQWFRWDKNRKGYYEIDEPECVSYICCFAIGQVLKPLFQRISKIR